MNYKQGCLFIAICGLSLTACVSAVWTGSSLVYGRHTLYKTMQDYQLDALAHHVLFHDKRFTDKQTTLALAVFNGDLLIAGHVSDLSARQEISNRLRAMGGYRHLYTQIHIQSVNNHGVQDAWISAKIHTKIIADSAIDPKAFKILTVDGIVYLMGDVLPEQGKKVLAIARNTQGVIKVVKLLHYYVLQSPPIRS